MKASRYGILLTVLTIVAIALSVYSIALPWYRLARDDGSAKNTYYNDIEKKVSGSDTEFVEYNDRGGFITAPDHETMFTVGLLIFVYVLAALIWIAAVLVNDRKWSIITGAVGLTLALASPLYFGLKSSTLVWESSEMGLQMSFMGSGLDAAEHLWIWGPATAWYLLLVAFLLQVAAFAIRSYVVVADLEP